MCQPGHSGTMSLLYSRAHTKAMHLIKVIILYVYNYSILSIMEIFMPAECIYSECGAALLDNLASTLSS